MMNIIKIVLFAIVNICGFYSMPILGNLAIEWEVYPKFTREVDQEAFNYLFLGFGMWVWIGGAVISLGYFFIKDAGLRTAAILSPLLLPTLYGTALIVYYNFSDVL